MIVETHHKRIEEGCPTSTDIGEVERAPHGRGIAGVLGRGGGAEEVGEAGRGAARRGEDVPTKGLRVDAKDGGCSLGSGWIQETVTASNLSCEYACCACK